ncbi:MAG: thioredoxin [Alloprevotella sp.]
MEQIITDANIAEIEAAGLPIVIDFSATWCGPCKKIAPIIEELAQEYEGRVIIGKCDVDENDELTSRFGIRSVPSVFFIKNGQIVDKNVGAAPKQTFVEKIEALLNA